MAAKDNKKKSAKDSDGLGEPVVKHVGGEDVSTQPSEEDQHDIEKGEDALAKAKEEEEEDESDEDDDDDDDESDDDDIPPKGDGKDHDGPWVPKVRGTMWNRATQRWIAVTAVLAFFLILYTQHPYYKHNGQFSPWRTIFPPAFFVWLALGVFYMKATLERWNAMRYLMRDGALHILILTRAFQTRKFWRRAKNRRIKTTLLAMIVKGFFTPLMIGFVTGHLNSISKAWLAHKHLPSMDYKTPAGSSFLKVFDLWWHNVALRFTDLIPSLHDLAQLVQPWTWSRADFSWGLGLFYDVIFAVDCGWALVGYGLESRWLGNKTRSVEPTAFGWLVCLSCYPPFNNVLGTYLPLDNGPSVITNDDWLLALRAATCFLFSIYAAATVAFGPRFSNLTNRGIVTRGPYRFVRHPAYLCKCSAWWLEHIPTITITKAFFLCFLCLWYGLRAWTEERHLSADPDYLAYKRKVPWVIFPGVY
ncbi:MAG: isoprenylcysteine carboxylmethyltransferase family protein [Labilithrix sp.]